MHYYSCAYDNNTSYNLSVIPKQHEIHESNERSATENNHIRERYKTNPKKMNEEVMALYKQEGIKSI